MLMNLGGGVLGVIVCVSTLTHLDGSNADVPVELLARELNCQCFWLVPIGPGRAGGQWPLPTV